MNKSKHMLVFIAGPLGDDGKTSDARICENIERANMLSIDLARQGMVPICPHTMCGYWIGKVERQLGMVISKALLSICDAVLRLPGRSAGTDHEVVEAESLGIPVFTDFGDMVMHFALLVYHGHKHWLTPLNGAK